MRTRICHVVNKIQMIDIFGTEADFCPAVFDGYLCWPKTSAGSTVELPCPKGVAGLDENSEDRCTNLSIIISSCLVRIAGMVTHSIIDSHAALGFIWFICVLPRTRMNAFNSLVASDFVTRQCLADGNWFSCPSKAPNATEVATGFSVATTATPALNPGWTNYTSCYTETTLKLFKDLDYETGCPKGEVAVDSEVKVRVDDIHIAEKYSYFSHPSAHDDSSTCA